MDAIRDALYDALKADSTLMALTGDGDAYYQRAPQDASTPLLVFSKQSGTPTWALGGQPVEGQLWLVKGIDRSDSASTAEAIDARVNTVLNNATLTITGHAHLYLRRESDVDYEEDDGAESYHHSGSIFRLIAEAT